MRNREREDGYSRLRRVITQLNPPLHLQTPKGPGWAHLVVEHGPGGCLDVGGVHER